MHDKSFRGRCISYRTMAAANYTYIVTELKALKYIYSLVVSYKHKYSNKTNWDQRFLNEPQNIKK